MYAIIRTGGHQEKVMPGERILIDRVKTDVGQTLELAPLMVSTDEGTVVSDPAQLRDTVAVVGTVVEHVRGDKVDVFQYRQKTGYRRHIGHRQALTLVEISEIRFGDKKVTGEEAKAAAAEEREAELKAAQEKRDAARKARDEAKAAKKPAAAARKTAAKKTAGKTAAKKTAGKKTAKKVAKKKK
ncbi:MAG: 50S ribosomal protein L21 [Actinobacteria bacterium]|nr:50S ribosomal protein L21 [Actinomycetota bacterium]